MKKYYLTYNKKAYPRINILYTEEEKRKGGEEEEQLTHQ